MNEVLIIEGKELRMYKKLASRVMALQAKMPKSSSGVMRLIDSSVVLRDLETENIADVYARMDDDLFYEVDYPNGYACVDGYPIWYQLPFELDDYYELFKIFKTNYEAHGVNALIKTSEQTNISVNLLSVYAEIYHWNIRVYEVEKFAEMQYAIEMRRRQRKVIGSQADEVEKMISIITSAFESRDFMLRLEPKELAKFLVELYRQQRIISGMGKDSISGGTGGNGSGLDKNLNIFNIMGSTNSSVGGIETEYEVIDDEQSNKEKASNKQLQDNMFEVLQILAENKAFDSNEQDDETKVTEVEEYEKQQSELIEITKVAQRTIEENKFQDKKKVYDHKKKQNSRGKSHKKGVIKKVGGDDAPTS